MRIVAAGSPWLFVSYRQVTRLVKEPYQKVLIALVVAALVVVPLGASPFFLRLMSMSFLAVISAVGLNLLTGYCGQLSLGHAAFMATGAFTTVVLIAHGEVPFWITVPAGCIVGALLGLLVGLPSLRFRGIYLAIATLAMHYAILYLLTVYQANVGPSATAGIPIPTATVGPLQFRDERSWYYLLLAIAAAVVVFGLNLARGRAGRAWVAIRDRDIAAAALGVDVARYKLYAFMVSAGLAALAGSLGAYFTTVVTVDEYTLELAILYIGMIIVGGMGSILGSAFGAFFLTLLPFAIDRLFGLLPSPWRYGSTMFGVQSGAIGLCIIGFLLFEPRGLVEIYRRVAEYFERWPFRYRELQAQARR
jgi:branched-chain amino acid transport system permease protein